MEPSKENKETQEIKKEEDNKDQPKEEKNKPKYNYMIAKKLGNKTGLITEFTKCPAYVDILDFIENIQKKMKGIKKRDVKITTNECLLGFDGLYKRLEEIYNNNPPKKGEERYNDPVFKRFHAELEENFEQILNETILKPSYTPKDIILELKTYFLDSFGNPFRLDYGTGHELNYFCFLLILYKSGMYNEEDFPYLILYVLYNYVLFVRKLQVEYILEPAGTRGAWGLDEYQFLPFIFGASQLIGNIEITPKMMKDDDVLVENKEDYFYLDCLYHIKTVKKGAPFSEYAPVLYSITKVPTWEKVAKGLVKMYENDVMKKFVVIQHFYFGSVLVLN